MPVGVVVVDKVGEGERLAAAEGVSEGLGVKVGARDRVGVSEGVMLSELVPVIVGLALTVCVAVAVVVLVAVGDHNPRLAMTPITSATVATPSPFSSASLHSTTASPNKIPNQLTAP